MHQQQKNYRTAFGLVGLLVAVAVAPAFSSANAADALIPIDRRQVRVGGEIGRRIEITVEKNLFALDVENDFLRPFRQKKTRRTDTNWHRFIGLGKLIDAAVRFGAYTNNSKIVALKNHLVSETIETQAADGYIGVFRPEDRMWSYYELEDTGRLIQGFLSDYQYYGNRSSLEAARKLADYVVRRWPSKPAEMVMGPPFQPTTIGLERGLIGLSEATGRKRYLTFCREDMGMGDWDHEIEIGRSRVPGRPPWGHCYRYMYACATQFDLNRIRPEEKLLRSTNRVLQFLAAGDGMVITGTCSHKECWHNNQNGSGDLGETCATAYLIRLMDSLIRLEGDSQYGDLMERAVYNSLFAAQSPDGRRLRYFTPFEGKRQYFSRDTYCCPNNFRRIMAELPTMIYYRSGNMLAVNLYTPSSATIKLGDGRSLNIRQQTNYPNSGRVVIDIDPSEPATFSLKLRIPLWSTNATVSVNDQPIDKPIRVGAFFTIRRRWKQGDRVVLEMPMAWRLVKGRRNQAGRVAVMRGPLVFCLNPARNDGLAKLQLDSITIDPQSIEGPVKDETIRPGGMACRVRAWSTGDKPTQRPDLTLLLSEFADPGGRATYFRAPDATVGVDDELLQLRIDRAYQMRD